MTEPQKNIAAATKPLASILTVTHEESIIEELLNDFLEGVKIDWAEEHSQSHNCMICKKQIQDPMCAYLQQSEVFQDDFPGEIQWQFYHD